jgi:amino acid adenylation domain-containing protein
MTEQTGVTGYRLSPQQRQVWRAQQGAGVDFAAQVVIMLKGELRREGLRAALAEVVGRHEILRTRFVTRPGMKTPVQVVAAHADPDWRTEDLGGAPAVERSGRVEQVCAEESGRPFDYERGPLVRLALLTLSPSEHALVITLPSLCADKESLVNLAREVSAAYAAGLNGGSVSDEPLQYADLCEWQNELLEGEDAEEGLRFWRESLGDAPRAHRLPLQFKPAEASTHASETRGAAARAAQSPPSVRVEIDAEVGGRLFALASELSVSIGDLLQACWGALLWRLTGEPALPLGLVSGGRYEELSGALGPLARRVAVVSRVEAGLSLGELCARVAEANRAAEEWQEYWGGGEGAGGAEPRVGFEYEESGWGGEAGGLRWELGRVRWGGAAYALNLRAARVGGGLRAELEYDAGEYGAEEAGRVAGYYGRLLAGACAGGAERLVGELEVVGGEERRLLVEGLNETREEYEPLAGVAESVEETAAGADGGRVAVECEGEALTYAELNARANQLARYLRGLEVRPETLVGICMERSLDLVVALLGVLKAGGAYVPLDVAFPKERLSLMLEDARVAVLLTQSRLAEALSGHGARVVSLDMASDEVARESPENLGRQAEDANLAYVLFTSGSTGRPKGVAVEHAQLSNYIKGVSKKLALPRHAGFATVSTFAADLGNTVIFPSLCSGGRLHVISQERATNPDALAEYFGRNEIDCLKIVPSHLEALLSAAEPEKVLPRSLLVLGGEASRPGWVDELRRMAPGCRVMNHYGPTETTVGVLTHEVGGGEARRSAPTLPLGRPLPNSRIYLLDARLSPVPFGVTGELYVGGEGVTRGYYNRPGATAERFLPDPFGVRPGARMYRTGDLARYLPGGDIEFLGRNDDQVKLHGFRVELGEIEWALREHASVREAVVAAAVDERGHVRLVAYVVGARGRAVSVEELRTHLGERLPEHMKPSSFVVLDALPLNANGKVDRRALPEPGDDALRSERAYVAPRTPLEEALAALWAEVLKVERVGVGDNFFALGGHSLAAMQIMARVRKTFQVELPLRVVFQASTVEKLARGIIEHEAEPGQSEKIAAILKKLRGMSAEEKRARLKERDAARAAAGIAPAGPAENSSTTV